MILAIVLALVIAVVAIPWAIVRTIFRGPGLSAYFRDCALSIDITGNVIFQHMFNDIMIPPDGYRFGKEGDTISYVLGHNKVHDKLYLPGKWLAAVLDFLDEDHVRIAYYNRLEP